MSSASQLPFQWQLNFKILLFAAVFLPATIAAGFWQLTRAEEKQQMLDAQSARVNLPAISVQELDLEAEQNYRRVTLQGRWTERYFLLENRVKNGRPGYEIVGLFESGEQQVLVNRGWVQASLDRQVLPELSIDPGETANLSGYAYRSISKPFTLGSPVWTERWPERIQTIDWEQLEARLGHAVFPYLVRLDAMSDGSYSTGWTIVNLPPQKHTAYAVQWFALAITLVVLSIFACSNLGAWIRNKLGKQE